METVISKTATGTPGVFIVERVKNLGKETIRQTETRETTGEVPDVDDENVTWETVTVTIKRDSLQKIGV